MSAIEQLKKLDEQRSQLIEKAKADALERAQTAIAELNALGFHYQLTEGDVPRHVPIRQQRQTTGTRRSGVRDEILTVIKQHPDGISPKDIIAALDAESDEKKQTSIRNALNNMKKAELVTSENGTYKAPA